VLPRSPPIDDTMMMLPLRRSIICGATRLISQWLADDVVVQDLAELLVADAGQCGP
jgi:hypothetical protein